MGQETKRIHTVPIRALSALSQPGLLLERFRRNSDFIRALIDVFIAESPEQRDVAIEAMLQAVLRRELARAIGPADGASKGKARRFLDNAGVRASLGHPPPRCIAFVVTS
jgi:hypothetical protein